MNSLTSILNCKYPIIAGPMFLVSNVDLVTAVSNAGAVGAMPSLNWRTTEQFDQALQEVRQKTSGPFGVNLIVNKVNPRVDRDLEKCVKHKVPLVITSLGSPKKVIEAVNGYGGKVFCDVVNLEYALKVQDQGCDGVIAVSSGAGGHAGPVSPLVLIPYLKSSLKIPVVAAGGIANGRQVLAALVLGAAGVQIGTRFIATKEAGVSEEYKNAVSHSKPEDIVLTKKISGTPASVIRTPFIEKQGLDLNFIENWLAQNPRTKKWAKAIRVLIGQKYLEESAQKVTWKNVWSAGQLEES
jgi:nitronate monooxygenase